MSQRQLITSIDQWDGKSLLSVLGPTGSGKTALVIDLVRKKFAAEPKTPLLVSVDSVTLYQELDIGSAKPTKSELSEFSWHGIDLFAPTEEINARKFIEAVRPSIDSALTDNRPVILVGGSFFYERALVEGMAPGDQSDPAYLSSLTLKTNEELYAQLLKKDPRWSEKIHPNDRYRLERYSDLTLRQKISFDDLFSKKKGRPLEATQTLVLGMEADRDQYLIRLQRRIHQMFGAGWPDEIKDLLSRYNFESAPALSSIGYLQFIQGLKNGRTHLQIEDDVLVAHIQLVKKQKTWLRGLSQKLSESKL